MVANEGGVTGAGVRKRQRGSEIQEAWLAYRIPAAWCVLAVVVALGIGASLAALLSPRPPSALDADSQISGVVTLVNEDGTSFCLTGEKDDEQHCSEVYLPPGSAPLEVGESVAATIAFVPARGGSQEVYIVTDRDSVSADDAEGASL